MVYDATTKGKKELRGDCFLMRPKEAARSQPWKDDGVGDDDNDDDE
jgi:hypothetical protein